MCQTPSRPRLYGLSVPDDLWDLIQRRTPGQYVSSVRFRDDAFELPLAHSRDECLAVVERARCRPVVPLRSSASRMLRRSRQRPIRAVMQPADPLRERDGKQHHRQSGGHSSPHDRNDQEQYENHKTPSSGPRWVRGLTLKTSSTRLPCADAQKAHKGRDGNLVCTARTTPTDSGAAGPVTTVLEKEQQARAA
jgi:hypothetical protein